MVKWLRAWWETWRIRRENPELYAWLAGGAWRDEPLVTWDSDENWPDAYRPWLPER